MTGMKINIERRIGMMSNIANTAVLRRRGGAGDADNSAGTKTVLKLKVYIVKILIHKESIITTTIIMTLVEITILVVILMKMKKKSLQRMM
jgi:hypothetical protein